MWLIASVLVVTITTTAFWFNSQGFQRTLHTSVVKTTGHEVFVHVIILFLCGVCDPQPSTDWATSVDHGGGGDRWVRVYQRPTTHEWRWVKTHLDHGCTHARRQRH